MSLRTVQASRIPVLALAVLLLGCGGGGSDDGGDSGGCGSAWNTQVVLLFTGPPGCSPVGYEEVLCARYWGVGHDSYLLEIRVPSPGCTEETILYFQGYTSAGGSMVGDDQVIYRECLVDALAPGDTSMHLENVGGEVLATSFTLQGDFQVYPSACTGSFLIEGALP